MAITYPLALPTAVGIERLDMRLVSVVAVATSPFTLSQQVYAHPGQRWQAEVRVPAISGRADADAWISFLVAMRGQFGTATFGDPLRATPRGVGTGTPLVNGGSQTGRALVTDGWTPSQAGIMRAGDYIQIGTGANTRLHMVVEDAASNGSGQATLSIEPALRASPLDNQAVITSSPVGLWRLSSNDIGWSLENITTSDIVLPFVEAL